LVPGITLRMLRNKYGQLTLPFSMFGANSSSSYYSDMTPAQRDELLGTLGARFMSNMARHEGLDWTGIRTRLESQPGKIRSLGEMERTGGEPDVIGRDAETGEYLFCDCSAESPAGRRSLCYDRAALESRKEHKPANSAVDMAMAMGIELLTETQYRQLQQFGPFDTKTSSWISTPAAIRSEGGALFCDYRYGHVFTYHNGAQSYYASRGFRGLLRV
jgi:hypothetical protein